MSDARVTPVFEARYRPGLGARFAAISWVLSAFIAVVAVFSTFVAFRANPSWYVIVICLVVFGFLLMMTVGSALDSVTKWGADDRLALRIDGEGLTLGRVGLLRWEEILEIRIMDTGGIHGNVPRRGFEALTGSATHQFVTVWVRDADAVIARTDGRARAARNLLPLDGHHGFDGVWGQGLDGATWGQAATALAVESAARGIPVHGRNDVRK
jgi:hypothetical protein